MQMRVRRLRLEWLHGWRLWVAIGLVLACAIALARPAVKIARSKRRRRIKAANPTIARISPHTGSELAYWVAVSLSAGFCEEFVCRGYLIWVFQPFLGVWGAAALSLVVFALAHSYQGLKGVVSVAIVGGLLTIVVLIFGSLWPAIALHVVADLSQGVIAWLAFRQVPGDVATEPAYAGMP